MKKFLPIFFSFLSFTLFAQVPGNDDCSGAIDLGTVPYCVPTTFYSNVNATASDFGNFTNIPGCLSSNNSPRDVWFQFTADASIQDYDITVTGASDNGSTPLNTPQLVLYRGFCQTDELIIMECNEANLGDSTVSIQANGLTPGLTYFLRVGDYSAGAPNSGTFKLCIQEQSPEVTIDQGSSDACHGVLYDSGGPDGNYGPNENYVFTICPTDFHQCISLNIDYYNLEGDTDFDEIFDEILVFDGADTLAPILAEIGDIDSEAYESDGGVNIQLYATSGCVTIQFKSDASTELEGFKATWQCSADACPSSDLISVDSLASDETLVDYLSTAYATTKIDSILCSQGSYGSFEATDNTGLGLKRGLLLTSGLAANAIGPNDDDSKGDAIGQPGDADLDSLSAELGEIILSHDACVVYLDVYAYTDKLSFEYIFGSEEYKEFANSPYNDIFAFLVSGPGIVGDPALNNQKNIAVIPNTNTPVQINSINHIQNWPYYHDNPNGASLQYDGFTTDSLGIKKTLTAEVDVIPCNHYKLKLAIADREDNIYDSGVFISEISAGFPKITIDFKNGLDYMVENCSSSEDILDIELKGTIEDTLIYNLNILGTATNGADYTLNVPATLSFFPGQTKYSFPISVLSDNIPEPTETIIVSLSADFGCGEVSVDDVIIQIKDQLEVFADIAADTLQVCKNEGIRLHASGAAGYQWTPTDIMDDPNIADPSALPAVSGWAVVTGTAGTCTDKDSVYLEVHDLQVSAIASDNEICLGQTIQLNALPNVLNPTYTWSPDFEVLHPHQKTTDATPSFSTNYVVEIEKFGCRASDTVSILVDTLFEPTLISDTTICLGQSVQLAGVVVATSSYSWAPANTLDDATISSATATPTESTTVYTLVTTSQNGYCSNTQTVTVNTIPASLQVLSVPGLSTQDTIYLCAPDETSLLAQTSTGGTGLTWLPADGSLSSLTDTLVHVTSKVSGLYTATLQVGACILHDSVFVRVDSLPNLAQEAVPSKDPYCPGDTVSIFSENYDQDAYQGIQHQWTPATGAISNPGKFNLVVITQDTITYTRTTQLGVCIDSSKITLNVDTPPDITITQDKDTICANEEVHFTATSPQGNDFVWMPANSLSCDKCPNPIATPSQTTTYSISLESANCPSEEQATITVLPTPQLQFPTDTELCPGESVQLNQNTEPGVTYVWTANVPNFDTLTTAQPTVTPTATTTYTVLADNGICTTNQNITIHVANDSLYIDGPDGVCPGYPITLTAVTNGTGTYVWMPDNIQSQSIDVEPSTPTTYSVTYTYGDGCILATSHPVVVYPEYTVSLTAEKDTVFAGSPIKAYVTLDPPLNNPTIHWTQNNTELSSTSEYLETPATDGPTDNITATLITPEGCEYPASITIIIKPVEYDIPNAFTPNSDGKNDVFKPINLNGFEIAKIQIFNRWGQQVYSGNTGWDGRFKGKKAPSDVYPYLIELKTPSGQITKIKGNVTLIR